MRRGGEMNREELAQKIKAIFVKHARVVDDSILVAFDQDFCFREVADFILNNITAKVDETEMSIRLRGYDINTLMAQYKNGELPNGNPVIDAMVKAISTNKEVITIGEKE